MGDNQCYRAGREAARASSTAHMILGDPALSGIPNLYGEVKVRFWSFALKKRWNLSIVILSFIGNVKESTIG